MTDQPIYSSYWRLPANAQEFWALILAIFIVFACIQFGAPLIREVEFLDPKLREYFIGMSLVGFPLIHRGCKQGLARISRHSEPPEHRSSPWFVTGSIAAALIFAWNQFVSFLSGLTVGTIISIVPSQTMEAMDQATLISTINTGAVMTVLPLSAAAALVAGIFLNRYTRSHTFAALGVASAGFVTVNTILSWAIAPETYTDVLQQAEAQGDMISAVIGLIIGVSFVGLVIFAFGCVGVFISRLRSERALGRILEAARHLPPEQRDALAVDLARRVDQYAHKKSTPANAAPSIPQAPSAAEP